MELQWKTATVVLVHLYVEKVWDETCWGNASESGKNALSTLRELECSFIGEYDNIQQDAITRILSSRSEWLESYPPF